AVALLVTAIDRRRSTAGRVFATGVLALALLATGSRSGLVGAGVGVVALALVRSRDPWGTAARGLVGATVLATVVAGLVASGAVDDVADAVRDRVWRVETVDSRFALYQHALELFADHPLLGLGVGGFKASSAGFEIRGHEQLPVHNTYLWAL